MTSAPPCPAPPGRGGRSPVLDWLAEEAGLRSQLATATSAVEAAAVLELRGINDDIVRLRTPHPSVFALAEDLNRAGVLGQRPVPDEGPAAGHGSDRPRLLAVNGLLYVLPCLVWVAALRPLPQASAGLLLLASALVWAAAQGLSDLLHRQLGRGARQGAARDAGRALAAALATTAAIWLLSPLVPGAYRPGVLASTAVLCFGAASTVLFVLGRRATLACVIAASAAMVGLDALLPAAAGHALALWAAVLLPAASTVAALRVCRFRAQAPPASWSDAGRALLSALYGGVVAVLALAPTVAALGRTGLGEWNLWAFPVVAGLGVAELLLLWFQTQVRERMSTQVGVVEFQRSTSTALLLAAACFLGVIALIDAAILGIAAVAEFAVPVSPATLLAAALLAVVLLFGGLLLALGGAFTAVLCITPGAVLLVVWLIVDAVGRYSADHVVPTALAIAAAALMTAGWHRATHLEHYR